MWDAEANVINNGAVCRRCSGPLASKPRNLEMRSLILVLFSLVLLSCNDNFLDPPSSDDDIREIVLRDMFLHNGSGFAPDYFSIRDTLLWGYYIEFRPSIDSLHQPAGARIDPDNVFLARFADIFPEVKKGSQCTAYKSRQNVVDTATGLPGLLFFIAGSVKRPSDSEVILDAGWYYNGANAGDYTYRLRKERSRWMIYSSYLNWIS
jgi:hypothetical protein